MAKSSLLDGFAYGVLNEIMAGFRGTNGYAKPAKYEVMITPPSGYRGTGSNASTNIFGMALNENPDDARKVSMEMSQASFPGMTLETIEDTNIYGPTRKIVSGQTFAEMSTSVRVSNDFRERNFFDNWQRIAANRQDFSVGYYDDYVGTMQIFQLDKENRRKHGVELVECYPSTVGELQTDYGNLNSLHLLPVTWSYRYWKNLTDEADLPKGLLERIGEVFVNTVERQIRSRIPAVLRKL
tara:strand:- start:41 stop:760 length:720 start_codon:yes stop_codon:yes gene_type:complete